MAFILLAVIGAFSTQAMEKRAKSTSNFPAYIKQNPLGTECDESDMCSDIPAEICTVGSVPGGTQLWGKNGAGRCVVELYRIHP